MFEGQTTNTAERGPQETDKYGIKVPVGYDAHIDGVPISTFMLHYGTGGTPWITVIDKEGIVRFNGFSPAQAEKLAQLIDSLRG